MSMISELVKELREASDWHYHNTDQDLGALLDKSADTIEMLSEKAREPKQGEWTPCSEGLPKEHEWIGTKQFGTTISDQVCITFDKNGKRFVKVMSLQNGELSSSDKQSMDVFHKGWKMLAWMPLPTAYEGVDDE